MKNKRLHITISLVLIGLTVGFIWINSALSGADSSQLSGWARELAAKILAAVRCPEEIAVFLLEHIRKVAHAVEYAVIGLELAILWTDVGKGFQGLWNALSTVLAIAVFDETIQLFATSRGPQITDVLLDTAGGTAGILTVYLIVIICNCIKKKPVSG